MAAEPSSSKDNLTLVDENLETTDEPSLAELKEMLVDIQISKYKVYCERTKKREMRLCS